MLEKIIPKIIGNDTNEAERDEWISAELKRIPANKKILDAGAGTLKWKSACSHLQYVSQDFDQYDGSGDGRGLQKGQWDTSKVDIISDIVNIPVADGEFDVILCSEVLEHLPYPELAIKEFARILHRGVLLLTAPFNSMTHFAPYHFCTGFNRYWYESTLSKYGFELEKIENNGGYFDYCRQEILRLPSMSQKYAGSCSFALKIATHALAAILKTSIKKDTGSFEMCTFGYHIRAKKK